MPQRGLMTITAGLIDEFNFCGEQASERNDLVAIEISRVAPEPDFAAHRCFSVTSSAKG
jgi:hypothetical protein